MHYLGSSENEAWKKFSLTLSHITARITFIYVFIRSSNIWLSYILNRKWVMHDNAKYDRWVKQDYDHYSFKFNGFLEM